MADAGKIVITPKGAYSSTKTYEWLDEVSYNGNAYVALKTVTGVTPSDDGVNWRLFMSSTDVDANVLVPKFTEASTRSNIVSGENLSTMFGKIKKWFTDLKSHAFKDLVNNLTTSTTGSALDASQGKILKDEVDGVNRNLAVIGKCKNEFNPTLATSTQSGVTCTNNNDGTYTLSGTNSGSSTVYFQLGVISISGTKNMRCLKGSTATSYLTKVNDFGYIRKDGVYTFDDATYVLTVKVDIGVTVNSVAKPMVTDNLNATYDDFVPYTGDGETLTHDVANVKNDLSTHTHNYAGSDRPGGPATYALQANKDGAGNVIDATYINKTYMRNYGAGSIAFGNNMFIGIFNGDIICSSDGQEWEVNFEPNLFSLLDNDEILLGITYGKEKFVSFSNKGCSYVSSDNGNTWTKTQTIITV